MRKKIQDFSKIPIKNCEIMTNNDIKIYENCQKIAFNMKNTKR